MVNSSDNDAIVNPVKGRHAPDLGPVAVMVSNRADLDAFCTCMNLKPERSRDLMMSRLYVGDEDASHVSAIGPVIGAPYAALLMETLIAWGARQIFFWGWCGSISHHVGIGDIVVPTGAYIDEGLSKHYHADEQVPALPSDHITGMTLTALRHFGLDWYEGLIWSTDAIFRETRKKVQYYQSRDVIGVEMEISALFSVAKFRGVEAGGICVVSDELATMKWRPGFADPRFKQSCNIVCEVIRNVCQML